MQALENLALKKHMKDHLMYVYMQQKLLLIKNNTRYSKDFVVLYLCLL